MARAFVRRNEQHLVGYHGSDSGVCSYCGGYLVDEYGFCSARVEANDRRKQEETRAKERVSKILETLSPDDAEFLRDRLRSHDVDD